MREKWTEEYEILATSLAASLYPHFESFFMLENNIFTDMFPNISPEASRFRVSTLIQLTKLEKSIQKHTIQITPGIKPFSKLLAQSIIQYNEDVVEQSCVGYIPISILSLTNFYIRVAHQFSVHSCFPGSKFVHKILLFNIKDPTTILRVVRTAKDDIFEAPVWEDDAALLPKSLTTSLEELTAFFGLTNSPHE